MATKSACVSLLHCQSRVLFHFNRTQINYFSLPRCFGPKLRSNHTATSFSETTAEDATSDVKSKESKRRPIWYYSNKGIRQRKVDQLLRKAKEVINPDPTTVTQTATPVSQDVHHMKNLLTIFLKCDFKEKEINKLLVGAPRLFSLSKKRLYTHLMDLQDSGYSKDTVKNMIMRSPRLLLNDEKEMSIRKQLSNLKQLDVTPKLNDQRCTYLVQKCPYLLTVNDTSMLQSKLKVLKRLGLNEQLIFELIMKFPNVLTMSAKSIEDKMNYVTIKLGGRATYFVKFPRTFTASLQRIKERHHYLLQEGYMKTKSLISEQKLRAIILTTDKDFIYRVTNTRMKDFRDFQQQFRENESGKELDALTEERRNLESRVKKLGIKSGEEEFESKHYVEEEESEVDYEQELEMKYEEELEAKYEREMELKYDQKLGELKFDQEIGSRYEPEMELNYEQELKARCKEELEVKYKHEMELKHEQELESRFQQEVETKPIQGAQKKVFDAFKGSKRVNVEEWYNTPFPEIDNNQDESVERLTVMSVADEQEKKLPRYRSSIKRKLSRENR